MATIVRTEKRKRGIFGMLVWWVFLAFNAIMAALCFMTIKGAVDVGQQTTDAAHQAGAAIGGTLATGLMLTIWLVGSLILGLIVALTRGKTVTTERVVD